MGERKPIGMTFRFGGSRKTLTLTWPNDTFGWVWEWDWEWELRAPPVCCDCVGQVR